MKRRITKSELKEDRFIIFINKANLFLRKRRGQVISWGIILGLVIILSLIIKTTITRWEREASKMLSEAQEVFRKAESPEGFRDVKEICKEIIKGFPMASSKGMAIFYIGSCEYRLGEYDEALVKFKDFLNRYPRHFLVPFVKDALANIYEEKGDYTLAISAYKDLIKEKIDFKIPYAWLSIGRCQAKLNNYKEARSAYEKVVKTFPHSSWAEEARLALSAMK